MIKTDFVVQMLDVLARVAPIDDNTSRAIDAEIRKMFGGREVKIRERAPLSMDVIDAGLRERKSVRAIAGELGVSRATIYRHLGKSRKSRKAAGNSTTAAR